MMDSELTHTGINASAVRLFERYGLEYRGKDWLHYAAFIRSLLKAQALSIRSAVK